MQVSFNLRHNLVAKLTLGSFTSISSIALKLSIGCSGWIILVLNDNLFYKSLIGANYSISIYSH